MYFHYQELYVLVKKNLIKIILGTILFTITYVLFMDMFYPRDGIYSIRNSRIEHITNPAAFQFYVEDETGKSFTNVGVLENQILSNKQLLTLRKEKNIDLIDTGSRKIIKLSQDENSKIIELYIGGSDESKNLLIANYFYNELTNNQFSILENKQLFFITTPTIIDKNLEYEMLTQAYSNKNMQVLITNSSIGVAFGFSGMIFLIILFHLSSDRLKSSFSYQIQDTDHFMLVNKYDTLELRQLSALLNIPNMKKKVVVQEYNTLQKVFESCNESLIEKDENLIIVKSISDVKDLGDIYRIVYIIKKNETHRSWYNIQRKFDENYNMEIYVVQVN